METGTEMSLECDACGFMKKGDEDDEFSTCPECEKGRMQDHKHLVAERKKKKEVDQDLAGDLDKKGTARISIEVVGDEEIVIDQDFRSDLMALMEEKITHVPPDKIKLDLIGTMQTQDAYLLAMIHDLINKLSPPTMMALDRVIKDQGLCSFSSVHGQLIGMLKKTDSAMRNPADAKLLLADLEKE